MFKQVLYIGMLFLFVSCSQNIEEYTENEVIDVNGTSINIKHYSRYSTKKGILSGHAYESYFTFGYKIKIPSKGLFWRKRYEPKKLTLCSDGSVYIYSVGIHQTYRTNYHNVGRYEKFIDKRYFFKLLGDAYWTYVGESTFNEETKECKTFDVPNKNYYENNETYEVLLP